MLQEIPENPHALATDLQEASNEPDRQSCPKQDPVTEISVQSSAHTIRHVRDFSTSTTCTFDSESGSSDSDSLSGRETDPKDDEDDPKDETEPSIFEHLRNPRVWGAILGFLSLLFIVSDTTV